MVSSHISEISKLMEREKKRTTYTNYFKIKLNRFSIQNDTLTRPEPLCATICLDSKHRGRNCSNLNRLDD